MAERVALRIHGPYAGTVRKAMETLHAVEGAYLWLYATDIQIDDLFRFQGYAPFQYLFFNWSRRIRDDATDDPRLLMLPENQLELRSAHFESPGFWEFLGALNPLQQLREYLNDRHERAKDRDYRQTSEAVRLDLENERLAVKVFSEKVDALKKAGLADSEIRRLFVPAARALASVGSLQDQGLITTAELSPMPSKTRNRSRREPDAS